MLLIVSMCYTWFSWWQNLCHCGPAVNSWIMSSFQTRVICYSLTIEELGGSRVYPTFFKLLWEKKSFFCCRKYSKFCLNFPFLKIFCTYLQVLKCYNWTCFTIPKSWNVNTQIRKNLKTRGIWFLRIPWTARLTTIDCLDRVNWSRSFTTIRKRQKLLFCHIIRRDAFREHWTRTLAEVHVAVSCVSMANVQREILHQKE